MSSPGSPGRELTCHARRVSFSSGTAKLCGRKTAQGSLLCLDHECIVGGCSRVRQEQNPYCFVHKPVVKAEGQGDLSRVTSR